LSSLNLSGTFKKVYSNVWEIVVKFI
jgi:hypothetical protein